MVEKAFITLKESMCSTPILEVFDFNNSFVLEYDSLGKSIGAMLMQEGCRLAFTNNHLREKS